MLRRGMSFNLIDWWEKQADLPFEAGSQGDA